MHDLTYFLMELIASFGLDEAVSWLLQEGLKAKMVKGEQIGLTLLAGELSLNDYELLIP
jgi:hypothetical protein